MVEIVYMNVYDVVSMNAFNANVQHIYLELVYQKTNHLHIF